MTPSLRFPLRAEGTELAHGMVPLAKRGEPYGGGKHPDPLLQVPPENRGNRACALRGSPREAGGTLRRRANKTLPTRSV